MPRRLGLGGAGWLAVLLFAVLTVSAPACQLIGGIDDIALAPGGDASGAGGGGAGGTGGGGTGYPEGGTFDSAALLDATGCTLGDSGVCYPAGEYIDGGYCIGEQIVACGAPAQPCCPGNPNGKGTSADFCTDPTVVCGDGGACTACGQTNGPCCSTLGAAGQSACNDQNATCVGSVCVACGRTGQPCCANNFLGFGGCQGNDCCDPGTLACVAANTACSNGQTCGGLLGGGECGFGGGSCGDNGSPCCANNVCQSGLTCIGAQCAHCGSRGEACCVDPSGRTECERGAVCSGSKCVACGDSNQPCCSGDVCTKGACDPASNTCNPAEGCSAGCGGVGEPCCPGSSCAPGGCCDPQSQICIGDGSKCSNGYACLLGSCTCGDPGHSCCAGPGSTPCSSGDCCDPSDDICVGNGGSCASANTACISGSCQACGTSGIQCCPGNTCASSGCCDSAKCVANGSACSGSGQVCAAGTCKACGLTGNPCCTTGTACTPPDCCDPGTGSCVATAAACQGNFVCTGGSGGVDGTCTACGNAGEICCINNTCPVDAKTCDVDSGLCN